MDKHDAFPRLYGAPGTFRPPKPIADSERPASLDDEPLEFDRSLDGDGGHRLAPRPYRHRARPARPRTIEDDDGELRPADVGLRGLAERLLRDRGARPVPRFLRPPGRDVGSGPAGE